MSGSILGAQKRMAARAGVTTEEYAERLHGEKWCYRCRTWRIRDEFGRDRSRSDGLAAMCLSCRRETYEPVERGELPRGRRYVPARDEDRQQARRRVNHLVDMGLLANPNAVPCSDCGHWGADRRHEYDHHLGYAAEQHEDVQPVCSQCHHERERMRG